MSGLRYGELAELRIMDLHLVEKNNKPLVVVKLRRSVSDIGAETSESAGRFDVVIGSTQTKNHDRDILLDAQTSRLLLEHIHTRGIADREEALLFDLDMFGTDFRRHLRAIEAAIPNDLPLVEGTTHRHGTISAYGPGKCRCEWCTMSVRNYRRVRRENGRDPKERTGGTARGENLSGHMPRDTFRNMFMQPAIDQAIADSPSPRASTSTSTTCAIRLPPG